MKHAMQPSLLGRLARARRTLGLLAVLALMPMSLSCFGRFPLTRAVYRLNADVHPDKWVRSIVMWLLIIIPVYGVAMFVDIIGTNLIQFWTGETVDISSATDAEGNTYALVPSADGNEARLTVSRDGIVVQEGKFVKQPDGNWAILDGEGVRQGTVMLVGKGIEVRDAEGNLLRSIAPEQVLLATQKAG